MKGRSIAIGLAVALPLAGVAAAVAIGGDGDDKPAVLQVLGENGAAGGGAETANALADEDAARGGASMSSMLAYVRYEAGPDLPALDGSGRAYRVTSGGDPEDVARRVAAAYGVTGDPVERDGSWIVNDGEREVSVYPAYGTQWSAYTTVPVEVEADARKAEASCAADGVCSSPPSEEYVEPTRPANLPTQDEARAIALSFLDEVGVDVDDVHVQVDDAVTAWAVTVDPKVDGKRIFGLGSYVSVGDNGVIESASGSVAGFEAADEYPLIGTSAAIDRLNEQMNGFDTGGPRTLEDTAVAADSGVAVSDPDTPVCDSEPCDAGGNSGSAGASTPGSPGSAGGGSDGSSVTIEPLPAEDTPAGPPAEPTVITLTDGEVGLVYYPSYDGTEGWLVPAYLFTADADEYPNVYTAVAIADEYLAPMEPVDNDGGGDTPAPEPATDPAVKPED